MGKDRKGAQDVSYRELPTSRSAELVHAGVTTTVSPGFRLLHDILSW